MVEWVEVAAKTVDEAVEAALEELGLESRRQVEIEVIQEPERRFFGASRDAIVKVKKRPSKRRRRRRRGSERGGGDGDAGGRKAAESTGRSGSKQRRSDRAGSESATPSRREERDGGRATRSRQREAKPAAARRERDRADRGRRREDTADREAIEVDVEEQRRVVHEFLEGLVGAFGLDGSVESEVGEDYIAARIVGQQTEALVGPQGNVMQAILELSRTIVQRKTQAGARIRLDIAGYMERRREALRIYAGRLAERVVDEGGEIMLEPMNAADRKVVHDVIGEIAGVRSFSEGEEPERSVVIAPDEPS